MKNLKSGNTIIFGSYEWIVLDKAKDKILILTKQMIAQRDYHNKKEEVTWETSNIRSFLNQEFYQQFSEDEKNQIRLVVATNLNNHWYKTSAEKSNDR